ncbi:hypothetical protein K4F52_009482 [Lecanicillium sp. MT-2017a]|nr:hypothetical protein K4F52_009482 [Lecanicillium sp. MT-2017a]
MASPFQPGDIVTFARLAWQVYQFGWADDLKSTKQYAEFGRDVKNLAESLNLLSRVVSEASVSLRREGGGSSVIRWDRVSLQQIVGDYDSTLRECRDLISSNKQYHGGNNPLKNIEWNVLVQPSVERLRQRIILHHSKIQHFLKPFEFQADSGSDLLCRIRQDVQRMHRDLACQINETRMDIHRLIGLLVPDLEKELDEQSKRQVHLLDIPQAIAERIRLAALANRSEYCKDEYFELQDLADAFILNFNKSTVKFKGGLLVKERTPPIDQYLNLLKCVWVFKRIKASPVLLDMGEESHWPSYARQLEEVSPTLSTASASQFTKVGLGPVG